VSAQGKEKEHAEKERAKGKKDKRERYVIHCAQTTRRKMNDASETLKEWAG
jgi:hypothetical protein